MNEVILSLRLFQLILELVSPGYWASVMVWKRIGRTYYVYVKAVHSKVVEVTSTNPLPSLEYVVFLPGNGQDLKLVDLSHLCDDSLECCHCHLGVSASGVLTP